jgi:rhodanese-related sulfurtransferase
MFRRRRSEYHTHHHRTPRRSLFDFMRKPAFQLGFVVFAVLVIVFLILIGQKRPAAQTPASTADVIAGQVQPAGTDVPNVISVEDAYDLYMSGSAYFLDVRERSEWDQIHIPGTVLLPLNQVAALVDKFPKDKPIIVVSGSDNRSQQGRDILKHSGFTNVTSMAGGIVFWQSKGYPIEP